MVISSQARSDVALIRGLTQLKDIFLKKSQPNGCPTEFKTAPISGGMPDIDADCTKLAGRLVWQSLLLLTVGEHSRFAAASTMAIQEDAHRLSPHDWNTKLRENTSYMTTWVNWRRNSEPQRHTSRDLGEEGLQSRMAEWWVKGSSFRGRGQGQWWPHPDPAPRIKSDSNASPTTLPFSLTGH